MRNFSYFLRAARPNGVEHGLRLVNDMRCSVGHLYHFSGLFYMHGTHVGKPKSPSHPLTMPQEPSRGCFCCLFQKLISHFIIDSVGGVWEMKLFSGNGSCTRPPALLWSLLLLVLAVQLLVANFGVNKVKQMKRLSPLFRWRLSLATIALR